MTVPRETSKEMYLVVETDQTNVFITPSVLDAVIVAGKAPEQHQDTMLWAGYDSIADVLTIKTVQGRVFNISNAEQVGGPP